MITAILGTNGFPLKNLRIELKNDCREIRVAALEGLRMISALREHPFGDELASDGLIEVLHGIGVVLEYCLKFHVQFVSFWHFSG
jgi:hypothetical protein